MDGLVDLLLICLLLTNLVLLGSSRLLLCIRTLAVQGILLSLLPILLSGKSFSPHSLILPGATFILRGIVFPLILEKTVRLVGVKREIEPFVGFSASLILGVAALYGCLVLAGRLGLSEMFSHAFLVPLSFFMIYTGLFLLVTRKKALTQVIGYLILENGISCFGNAAALEFPWLVEAGILLDILAGVFIMGILVFHINREFDHIDTQKLSGLRDWRIRGRKRHPQTSGADK